MPRKNKRSLACKRQWKLHKESLLATNYIDCTTESDEEPNDISVSASYSQSDHRFSDYSKGKQCLTNSLMFLALLHEGNHMDQECLDYVLRLGDQLYCQIRQSWEECNRFFCRHLIFDDLPESVETDRGSYVVWKFTQMEGLLLEDDPEGRDDYINLSLRLEGLGTAYSQALMFVGDLCIAVFKDQPTRFGFFDPHSRNADGTCFEENGKAVMVTCHSASDLAIHLLQLFHGTLNVGADEPYHILPVCFERSESEHGEELSPFLYEKDSLHTGLPLDDLKLSKARRRRARGIRARRRVRQLRELQVQRIQQSLNENQDAENLGNVHIW